MVHQNPEPGGGKAWILPSFSGLPEERLSRNPKAYSNMVSEMNLITSLIDKGKGKASESQQGFMQYSGVTTPRSERGKGAAVTKSQTEWLNLAGASREGGKGREVSLTPLSSHPWISCCCFPIGQTQQESKM